MEKSPLKVINRSFLWQGGISSTFSTSFAATSIELEKLPAFVSFGICKFLVVFETREKYSSALNTTKLPQK